MKPGQESKTAVVVCMGRALANGDPLLPMFSDPTAFALLPDEARKRVERVRSEGKPKGLKQAIERGYLQRQAKIMAVRTMSIDDAIRRAAAPQLVILGAGLDGRAWRMPELAQVTVFEVDHPDSQREKRKRVAALRQMAADVRFVPVDFAQDDLERSLAAAGHDANRATIWVWEGVIMYLTRSAIEATLAVIERRSTPGSQLSLVYHSPAFVLRVVGVILRLVGEPLRSAFSPESLRSLVASYGFEVVRDQSVPEIGRIISAELGVATKVAPHLRIATAERRP
jgi:methyltransferase (TIGR00027 family)